MPEAAPIPSAPTPGAWRGAGFGFTFPRPAIVMGVLNVTPDSFSDGGRFFNPQAAVEQAEQMLAEGAEIIDIGGESTRPNATPVAERDEITRVVPVIRAIRARSDAVLSIDTQKPAVARAALDAGAVIVNDIAANRDSAEMWRLVAERRAGYVAMHMQGTPGTMQQDPGYQDVVAEVKSFFDDRLQRFREAGMTDEQTVLDVGIGFGKTLEHNLQLLGSLRAFTNFRRPQLLGVSRKSLFAKLLGLELDERLAPGIAVAAWAILNGVQILRVHDVAPTVHALRTLEAVTAESGS
jgi:dihydropteroate synthase